MRKFEGTFPDAESLHKKDCTMFHKILKILPPKIEIFQRKKSDIFNISAKNIYYGYSLEPPRRGGSKEYPQSMIFSKIRKIMYTL